MPISPLLLIIAHMKLLASVIIFAALPFIAIAEQQRPAAVYMTIDGSVVSGLDSEIRVSTFINITPDTPAQTHIRVQKVLAGGLNLDLSFIEANALATELEWAAGTAEHGANLEKPIWGNLTVVTLNSNGLMAATIRRTTNDGTSPITLTSENARALAQILKLAAANAEWLEVRAPELMKD